MLLQQESTHTKVADCKAGTLLHLILPVRAQAGKEAGQSCPLHTGIEAWRVLAQHPCQPAGRAPDFWVYVVQAGQHHFTDVGLSEGPIGICAAAGHIADEVDAA